MILRDMGYELEMTVWFDVEERNSEGSDPKDEHHP